MCTQLAVGGHVPTHPQLAGSQAAPRPWRDSAWRIGLETCVSPAPFEHKGHHRDTV